MKTIQYEGDTEQLLRNDANDRVTWYLDELSRQPPEMKENIIRAVKDITEAGI
ncbi:hypothetical protein LCGC14_1342370 [marine sediment metagenome]|uniref:Uncharacterized protein n=1 Tax=marine sediment metagenome TaxID=412755 RepID=A0A0F9KD60_9ZZZZ